MGKLECITFGVIILLVLIIFVEPFSGLIHVKSSNGKSFKVDKKCLASYPGRCEELADLLAHVDAMYHKLMSHLFKKYDTIDHESPLHEFIYNLTVRYNSSRLRENLVKKHDQTSYVLDKGKEVCFCLDDLELHTEQDKNILEFVALHEFAHIGLDSYGHEANDNEFWSYFKFLIREATLLDIHKPVNYSVSNIRYCGKVDVDYNPFYDSGVLYPEERNEHLRIINK